MRHNKFHDRVVDLAGKAFTPTHMQSLIYACCFVHRTKGQLSGSTHPPSTNNPEATGQKGDLLICDLWQNCTNSAHGMRVLNTDAKSHLEKTLDKCLQEA